MKDAEPIEPHAALHATARAYCDAVYFARPEVFEDMCHDRFLMTLVEDGGTTFWDKASFLERVRGRAPGPGNAVYRIASLDIAGDEIARVHLEVAVRPVLYEDHLGFIRVDGTWKLLTKVFRVAGTVETERTR